MPGTVRRCHSTASAMSGTCWAMWSSFTGAPLCVLAKVRPGRASQVVTRPAPLAARPGGDPRASPAASLPRVVAHMLSPAVLGLETSTVEVEVDLRAGLPAFSVVGLPDAAVQEARERVRSGLANQAFAVPARRIVANLAPADLRKAGPAVRPAAGARDPGRVRADGAGGPRGRRRGGGARPRRVAAAGGGRARHGRARGPRRMAATGRPARETPPRRGSCRDWRCSGRQPSAPRWTCWRAGSRATCRASTPRPSSPASAGAVGPDLAEVRGQGAARRALEVAAAGGHSILMTGPPGAGKTMLARRLPGILPPLVHRRGDRRHAHPLGGGAARRRMPARRAAAVPGAPPHGLGRGAGGRRPPAAARAR